MTRHLQDAVEQVLAYHRRTKHHMERYARSAGYLDWDTQPDPFRTWTGAVRFDLPLCAGDVDTHYGDLYRPGAVAPRSLDPGSLGAFFELALGLTAWKELDEARWSLRSDPSSGNLHPTEGYVVLPETAQLEAGLYHYVSRDHALERRCQPAPSGGACLAPGLPVGAFLVGLSSIHWRESWKYGERAFRYCQHDLGHVIGTVCFAAAALGWRAFLVEGLGDEGVARLLGLDRGADFAVVEHEEREHPGPLLLVTPAGGAEQVEALEQGAGELLDRFAAGHWHGTPNVLSSGHVDWEIVDAVARASARPAGPRDGPTSSTSREGGADRSPRSASPGDRSRAERLIRQRRSAVALDGTTRLTREQFYAMLQRTLPRPGAPPWNVLPWEPRLHLGVFVHRVDGLEPGLYLLERRAGVLAELRAMIGERASWERPEGCPADLGLVRLVARDLRRASAAVSCHQEIAADGAFSLGMLAEFRAPIETGPWRYRRLFWESGLIGQVLYLEAEAAGVRATGIGCFFDDAFHEILGLEGERFQSLYHFTVGGPVDDDRLATHPAYAHLAGRPGAPSSQSS